MNKMIIAALMILIFPIYGGDEKISSIHDERTRILRYGIDTEVVEVITAITIEKDNSYNDVFLDIFSHTGNSKIQLKILSFFEQQEDDSALPAVLEILRKATEDYEVNEQVLSESINYCGSLKSGESAEYLYKLSENSSKGIAAAAIRNLGKTGDAMYADKFLKRIQDDDFEDDEQNLLESSILLMGDLKYEPSVLTLIDIAQDDSSSPTARRYSCDSLGKIGDEQAIPVLKELLNDSDSILRSYALSSLAYFEKEEIEPILIQALRDSYWKIRVAAAKALSKRKSEDAVDILIYKAEKDPESNVKKAAMEALSIIGNKECLNFLSSYIDNDQNSDALRSTAINVFLKENASNAVDPLKKLFDEEWEAENSWIFNYTCKELSTTESSGLDWFYRRMLDHKNYIIKIYGVRGIRLNNIVSLYDSVKKLAEDENQHKALRKEAASFL